jgi:hypothetical protein
MSKDENTNKLALIEIIKPNITQETLNAFDSLSYSANDDVVDLHKKLSISQINKSDLKTTELIGPKHADLIPMAEACLTLSNLVDLDPKPLLKEALSILDDEPDISQLDLARKLLHILAKVGPPEKLFSKLAKEMMVEGWGDKNA